MAQILVAAKRRLVFKDRAASTKKLPKVNLPDFFEQDMQVGSNCSWLENAHELALDSDTDFLPNFKPQQAGYVVRMLKIRGQQLNFTE